METLVGISFRQEISSHGFGSLASQARAASSGQKLWTLSLKQAAWGLCRFLVRGELRMRLATNAAQKDGFQWKGYIVE
jgi:hypothetical protein